MTFPGPVTYVPAPALATTSTRATQPGPGLQLDDDLTLSAPVLRDGIALAARKFHRLELDPRALRVEVDRIEPDVYKVDTNVAALLNLDAAAAHTVVVRGVLAVGGMDFRIGLIERLHGISGCEPQALPVLDSKLRSPEIEFDPDAQGATAEPRCRACRPT